MLLLYVQLDGVGIMSPEAAPWALCCVDHVGVREGTAGGERSWLKRGEVSCWDRRVSHSPARSRSRNMSLELAVIV